MPYEKKKTFIDQANSVKMPVCWPRSNFASLWKQKFGLDAEQNNTGASKPVARHFNLPNHSHYNMTICRLTLHHGNTESRKNLEQKLIFQLSTLLHTESMNASYSTNLFTTSCDHIFTNGKAPLHSHINHNNPQFLYSL